MSTSGTRRLDSRYTALAAGILLCFLSLAALELHGFSLPMWHHHVDASPTPEVLLGQARGVRQDDFAAALPMILSQRANDFAPTSDLLGYGNHNVNAAFSLPSTSWPTLFRPHVWGYFIGQNVGLAWHWWFRVFGLFVGVVILASIATRNNFWLSAGCGLLITTAPLFQFWSFAPEPIVFFSGLSAATAIGVLETRSHRALVLYAAALFYCLGGLVFGSPYPAYQVVIGYFLVFFVVGALLRDRSSFGSAREHAPNLLAFAAAAFAVCGLVVLFYMQNQSAIQLLQQTVYPGQRTLASGTWELPLIFSNDLILFDRQIDWRFAANICEGSQFVLTFPVVLGALLLRRRISDPLLIALGSFVLLTLAWTTIGLPDSFDRVLLLDNVPVQRTIIGLGLADALLLVLCLSERGPAHSTKAALGLAAAWSLFLLWIANELSTRWVPPDVVWQFIPAILLLTGLSFLIVTRRQSSLALLVALNVAGTFWFNPIVRGGFEFIEDNPLSSKILELGSESRWISIHDRGRVVPANFLRMLGVQSVSGLYFYPHPELWEILDAEQQYASVWNRYAYVTFQLTADRKPSMRTSASDSIIVDLNPDDRTILERLDIDYVLYKGNDTGWRRMQLSKNFRRVYSYRNNHILAFERAASPQMPGHVSSRGPSESTRPLAASD